MVNGFLNDLPPESIGVFEQELFRYMDNHYAEVLASLRTKGVLDNTVEAAIQAALAELTPQFASVHRSKGV